MSTNDINAQKVWFDDDNMWLLLTDGRQLSVPLAYFPHLLNAAPDKRNNFELSGGGTGIHWDELDEDISIPHLFIGHILKEAV